MRLLRAGALLITLVMIGATGCAAISNMKEPLLVGVHSRLLHEEFDATGLAVLDLPLRPEDKKIVEHVIHELDLIRSELANIYRQNAGQVALTLSQSYGYVERIKTLYLEGRTPVLEFYESTGNPIPGSLVNYDQSALYAYTAINEQLTSAQTNVDVGEITGLLSLVFRVYSAAHGVPSI